MRGLLGALRWIECAVAQVCIEFCREMVELTECFIFQPSRAEYHRAYLAYCGIWHESARTVALSRSHSVIQF